MIVYLGEVIFWFEMLLVINMIKCIDWCEIMYFREYCFYEILVFFIVLWFSVSYLL